MKSMNVNVIRLLLHQHALFLFTDLFLPRRIASTGVVVSTTNTAQTTSYHTKMNSEQCSASQLHSISTLVCLFLCNLFFLHFWYTCWHTTTGHAHSGSRQATC